MAPRKKAQKTKDLDADDIVVDDKAAWEAIVSEPGHTRALTTFEDNRLAPLNKRQKETPDEANVRRWFGEPAGGQKFDDVLAAKFLEFYSRSGRKADAALYAGVNIATINRWEGENLLFRELSDEAHQVYLSMLEAEALRRGVEGVLEPIVAGKDPEIVTYVRKFSDKLLEMLLKKADPTGYGNKDGVNVNVQTGVLVAPQQLTAENDPLPVEDVPPDDDD